MIASRGKHEEWRKTPRWLRPEVMKDRSPNGTGTRGSAASNGRRGVNRLPIKFTETLDVEFLDHATAETSQTVTFWAGEVVNYLVVTDFDDFSAILEFPDGRIAYGVPKSCFVCAPNF